jgi:predicted hydrocarbon binding protein
MLPLRLFAIAVLTDLLKEFSDSIRTILASGGHLWGQPRLERRRLLPDEPENFLQGVLVVHDSGTYAFVDSEVALLKVFGTFFCKEARLLPGQSVHP